VRLFAPAWFRRFPGGVGLATGVTRRLRLIRDKV